MHASVGDRIVVHGRTVGQHERVAEVMEVRGTMGGPPYRIRYEDDGHECLIYPGPDSEVRHLASASGD